MQTEPQNMDMKHANVSNMLMSQTCCGLGAIFYMLGELDIFAMCLDYCANIYNLSLTQLPLRLLPFIDNVEKVPNLMVSQSAV
jgi:hypothetical protein